MTKTLKKLRQEPSNIATTNGRSTPSYAGPTPFRPMTIRGTAHQNSNTTTTTSNFYYQLPGGTKGPLPAELITKRATSLLISNNPPNGLSHHRVLSGTGPLITKQPSISIRNEIRSIDTANTRVSTPLRVPTKSFDTDLQQVDGFDYNNSTKDEHPNKFRVKKKRILILS